MSNIGKKCVHCQIFEFSENAGRRVWSPGVVVDEDYVSFTVEYYSPMPPDKKTRKIEKQYVMITE
jgi:hypothetical protein